MGDDVVQLEGLEPMIPGLLAMAVRSNLSHILIRYGGNGQSILEVTVAQKTVVTFEDDLDGSGAEGTVTFALNGVQYELRDGRAI
jgi:hypothetical protein